MRKSYDVSIFNHKFSVKSDSDERYVQRIANYVNEKVFHIKENTHSVSSLNVALLAALNIADDFFKMKESRGGNKELVKNKIQEIISLIESGLEGN